MTVENLIKKKMFELLGHNEYNFDEDLSDEIGLDSLERVELIYFCTDEYGVNMNDYYLEGIYTLNNLKDFIEFRII
tara:strand:- start:179 stop:406 length:228 start_codon:yes stop_codon:yes gene_type:complete